MTVTSVRSGPRLLVSLRGDLDMATVPAVAVEIEQLLAVQVPGRLVVDLVRVGFMDSACLALLADLLQTGGRLGFRVALVGVAQRQRRLLNICEMSGQFETP